MCSSDLSHRYTSCNCGISSISPSDKTWVWFAIVPVPIIMVDQSNTNALLLPLPSISAIPIHMLIEPLSNYPLVTNRENKEISGSTGTIIHLILQCYLLPLPPMTFATVVSSQQKTILLAPPQQQQKGCSFITIINNSN